MTEGKKKNLTIRLYDDVRVPAATAAARMDSTIQDVVEQFLRELGAGERTIVLPPPSESPFPARYERDLELLVWILDHGTQKDREWIRGSLQNFTEAIRGRGVQASRKRVGR
jgi:hypothetical protein